MNELLTAAASHPLWAHRQLMLYVVFALMLIEIVMLVQRFQETYRPALMLSTTAMWIVEQGGRLAMYPARLFVFVFVASLVPHVHLAGGLALVLAYVSVDFLYYWKHRLLHGFDWAWALHAVHHSSDDLNLMAAIRLGWIQRWLDDFFYLPLVVLGFDPVMVMLVVELNHASQFWCHTRCVGRLPWLDGVINTPSNHRVHHAAKRTLSNSNYGSTLMCWDKLFGTYVREPEPGLSVFGLEEGSPGLNPLRIQLGPLLRLWMSRVVPHPKPQS